MIGIDIVPLIKTQLLKLLKRIFLMALILGTVFCLSACGSKDKKARQALVRVNGEEITLLQLNDELKRSGVNAEQQEAATKQLLEALIDRQLIVDEARRNKIDRTPEVMQGIERAKAQIIVQAFLKSIDDNIAKPSMVEIDDYFQKHPEFFTQRKQYDMQQLVIATKDISNELMLAIESAKSLDEVTAWLDKHNVRYESGQLSRNSTDLPEDMLAKFKDIHKGQLFTVNAGENSLINFVTSIKDIPVTAKIAAPQIEQYLINIKIKEAAEAEVTHLRALAKIEYLNATAPVAP
ncbi:hypothetical protein GALL_179830 [mine drainage metagenome]|uniref:peptidylprolyl isomerase n=1 Tax=mine drainage metagenome TaxID=410659 RepID=A0A1J5S7B2_9ZZZZ